MGCKTRFCRVHLNFKLIIDAFDLKVPAVNNILFQFKKQVLAMVKDYIRNNPGNPRKVPC